MMIFHEEEYNTTVDIKPIQMVNSNNTNTKSCANDAFLDNYNSDDD